MNTPSLNLANENWQRVVDHDQRLTDHESIDLSFDLNSLDLSSDISYTNNSGTNNYFTNYHMEYDL